MVRVVPRRRAGGSGACDRGVASALIPGSCENIDLERASRNSSGRASLRSVQGGRRSTGNPPRRSRRVASPTITFRLAPGQRSQTPSGYPLPLACLNVQVTAANPALVAQWIEHLTTDQKVGGSSPSERATSVQVSAGFSFSTSRDLRLVSQPCHKNPLAF